MEIVIVIVLGFIALGILVALSPFVALACFGGSVYEFSQGNIWIGIGALLLGLLFSMIAAATDGGPVVYIIKD